MPAWVDTRNHEEGVAFDRDRQHQQKLQRELMAKVPGSIPSEGINSNNITAGMMDTQARQAERWAAPGGENGDGGVNRRKSDHRPPAKGSTGLRITQKGY